MNAEINKTYDSERHTAEDRQRRERVVQSS